MKKLWILALVGALLLTGCGKKEEPVRGQITAAPATTQAPQTQPTETQPPETTAPQTEPAQDQQTQQGGTYENHYAGFGCQLDSTWTFYGAQDLQELDSNVEEAFTDADLTEMMGNADQLTDMMAENPELLQTVNIQYRRLNAQEKLAFQMLSNEDEIDAMIDQKDQLIQAYESMGMVVHSIEKSQTQFLGESVWVLKSHMEVEQVPYYTTQVMLYDLGDFGLTLTAASFLEDQTQQVLDLFYALSE